MDVKELHQAAKAKYWQDKDLAGARRLMEQGIALAREQGLKGEEKAMNFDLASFCWHGWDEPGIVITAEDEEVGARAAEENLRLAKELDRPAFPMSNAWWMVGAYRLQAGDFEGAKKAFEECRELTDGIVERRLMAEGYLEIARMFSEKTSDLESVCKELRTVDGEGPAYADQLETACRVFQRRWALHTATGGAD